MTKISLPHNFTPRNYQKRLLSQMDKGTKRAICIWHRRCGKDKTLINLISKKAFEKKGIYYYFFPTYAQGRKVLWDGIDSNGFALIDHFPKELIKNKNDQQMKITLKNGSIFQIIGTDDIDSIRGTNPIGAVFSEYAFQNPEAWEVIRPILAENSGWAVFNTTPNGKNHAYKMYKMAEKNPNWYAEKLTISDTNVISEDFIEEERQEGMSEDMIQREYYCSFEASIEGAYYAKFIKKPQIKDIPEEKEIKVDTWWDLGMSDSTAIIFTQTINKEIRVIDYLEASGESLDFYIQQISKKPYQYGTHHAPHDIRVRELGTGKSRWEIARKAGIDFKIVKNIPLIDGINAGRNILKQCHFDRKKASRLLECLEHYQKAYDFKLKMYKSHPLHDWSSHGADAFRYMAVGHKEKQEVDKKILKENCYYRRQNYSTDDVY